MTFTRSSKKYWKERCIRSDNQRLGVITERNKLRRRVFELEAENKKLHFEFARLKNE